MINPKQFSSSLKRLSLKVTAFTILAVITPIPTLASFDQEEAFSSFIPAIAVNNDTRFNLMMLLHKAPLIPHGQIQVGFDQSTLRCNMLNLNIMADFWDITSARDCITGYGQSYNKAAVYLDLLTDAQVNGTKNQSTQIHDYFLALPTKDQNQLLEVKQPGAITSSAFDEYRKEPEYTYHPAYYISNTLDSVILFFTAVNNDASLTEPIRDSLKQYRLNLYLKLKNGAEVELINDEDMRYTKPTGNEYEFVQYLVGAELFYAGEFHNADGYFNFLATSNNPWIAETSAYMKIRTALNLMGKYENAWDILPTSVDPTQANKALAAIEAYRTEYPSGIYLNSALKLVNRILWLQQDNNKLTANYEQDLVDFLDQKAMVESADYLIPSTLELIKLADEIDAKLLESSVKLDVNYPILAFIQALKQLRSYTEGKYTQAQQDEIKLETSKISQGLIDLGFENAALYLQLVTDWKMNTNPEILNQIPNIEENQVNLSDPSFFAMQILRSDILKSKKDKVALLDLWTQIMSSDKISFSQRQYAELELASAYILNQHPEAIFTPNSPITNFYYRAAVLEQTVNRDLLRKQAIEGKNIIEKRTALYALLKNGMHQLDFKNLKSDYALLPALMLSDPSKSYPENYPYELKDYSYQNLAPFLKPTQVENPSDYYTCPSLSVTLDNLAIQGTNDADAALCLGDFLLIHFNETWEDQFYSEFLNDGVEAYRNFNRGQIYDAVLNNSQATENQKAYALYRKINCYATSGYNGCGDEDVEQSERKRWFQTLKSTYKNSAWAQQQKYYW